MQKVKVSSKAKKSIAIIGAGQAGLQLACGLLIQGYAVSIFSNRSPEQIYDGQILSNQGMFNAALNCERKLSLDFWEGKAPKNTAITMMFASPHSAEKAFEWTGRLSKFYQAVDQRLKFSYWMKYIQNLGGNFIIKNIDLKSLDEIASQYELTIVASGKGEIGNVFRKNSERSKFYEPQRALACIYVKNIVPMTPPGVRVSIIPLVGEYFVMPGLSLNGPCEMMQFEGIPNGPFDCWNNVFSGEQQLEKALQLLKKYVPWEAERCRDIQLADQKAILQGRYTPVIKYPTAILPCGKAILGVGDAVILNDPIAGQGSNNAAKAASHYLKKIVEHGENEFTEDWMQEVFEEYWNQDGKWATEWSNLLLKPPEQHVIELLTAASKHPEIANRLANGFDNPSTLFPWIMSEKQTYSFIDRFSNTEVSH